MMKFHGAANTLGLSFFGTMTASISHEVKNCLAIINENAGLLDDLLMLAERGRPLSAERLKQIAGNMQKQTERANGIVGRLNRFAHSAKHPVTKTTSQELCEFSVSLVERLANLKKAEVSCPPGKNLEIHIRPFVFFNLLWAIFEKQFTLVNQPQKIQLTAEEKEIYIVFTLQFDTPGDIKMLCEAISAEYQPLIIVLRASISADSEKSCLQIAVPKMIEE